MSHKELTKPLKSDERKLIDSKIDFEAVKRSLSHVCAGCKDKKLLREDFINHMDKGLQDHVPFQGSWICRVCNQATTLSIAEMRTHIRRTHFCHQHSTISCKKHWYEIYFRWIFLQTFRDLKIFVLLFFLMVKSCC